jgi:hypothetical protein
MYYILGGSAIQVKSYQNKGKEAASTVRCSISPSYSFVDSLIDLCSPRFYVVIVGM